MKLTLAKPVYLMCDKQWDLKNPKIFTLQKTARFHDVITFFVGNDYAIWFKWTVFVIRYHGLIMIFSHLTRVFETAVSRKTCSAFETVRRLSADELPFRMFLGWLRPSVVFNKTRRSILPTFLSMYQIQNSSICLELCSLTRRTQEVVGWPWLATNIFPKELHSNYMEHTSLNYW